MFYLYAFKFGFRKIIRLNGNEKKKTLASVNTIVLVAERALLNVKIEKWQI